MYFKMFKTWGLEYDAQLAASLSCHYCNFYLLLSCLRWQNKMMMIMMT